MTQSYYSGQFSEYLQAARDAAKDGSLTASATQHADARIMKFATRNGANGQLARLLGTLDLMAMAAACVANGSAIDLYVLDERMAKAKMPSTERLAAKMLLTNVGLLKGLRPM